MSPSMIFTTLAGLVLLIFISVRQMRWQSADRASKLRLPMILVLVGLIMAAQTFGTPGALRVSIGDLGLVAVEAGIAVAGGWLMGRLTQISTIDGGTRSRLSTVGLAVWLGFLAIRIGAEVLAHLDHLTLAASTPLILFMIAIVKGTQALTVRARVQQHLRTPLSARVVSQ